MVLLFNNWNKGHEKMIKVEKEEATYLWCQSCRKKNVELFVTEVLHEVEQEVFEQIHQFRLCEKCYDDMNSLVKIKIEQG